MKSEKQHRPGPEAAARAIVEERYPDALAAFVAGSVVRGAGTPTSDLDLVIILEREEAPFREGFTAYGWPVSAFVHTTRSYRWFFEKDAGRRMPALAAMCREGVVLRDVDGIAASVRADAVAVLDAGPAALTDAECGLRRYMLTDMLDDLRGAPGRDEAAFAVLPLVDAAANLLLAVRRQWGGSGKALLRALRRSSRRDADALCQALTAFQQGGDRAPLIAFTERVLEEAGGPFLDGFYEAGPREARGGPE